MVGSMTLMDCGIKEPMCNKVISKANNYNKLAKLQQCIKLKENKLYDIKLSKINKENQLWIDG